MFPLNKKEGQSCIKESYWFIYVDFFPPKDGKSFTKIAILRSRARVFIMTYTHSCPSADIMQCNSSL